MTIISKLRPYTAADEDAAIELWRRTWHITFRTSISTRASPGGASAGGRSWCRWRAIVVAEQDGGLTGFVTVDPKTHYLDQIVVAPEHWGSGLALALLDEAKRLSPAGLELQVNKDNARAIRFYEKHGFVYAGEDVNPVSGKPVNKMAWRP